MFLLAALQEKEEGGQGAEEDGGEGSQDVWQHDRGDGRPFQQEEVVVLLQTPQQVESKR